MSETRTSELPNIIKASTVVNSPNNKLPKSTKLSVIQNNVTLNAKLITPKEEPILKQQTTMIGGISETP